MNERVCVRAKYSEQAGKKPLRGLGFCVAHPAVKWKGGGVCWVRGEEKGEGGRGGRDRLSWTLAYCCCSWPSSSADWPPAFHPPSPDRHHEKETTYVHGLCRQSPPKKNRRFLSSSFTHNVHAYL